MQGGSMLTATEVYTGAKRFKEAYGDYMAPLSRELGMSQTALDILMFLANNPSLSTAAEVCGYLRLKSAIVSFHVEKLVQQGLLQRLPAQRDRRRSPLAPTEAAQPLIEQGRRMQEAFSKALLQGLKEEELQAFERCLAGMEENLKALERENTPKSKKERAQ